MDPVSEIVSTASRLIERDGIEALSPSSIARELGVARTVVYHHVGDVDAVLAAVGDQVISPLIETVSALTSSPSTAEGRIRRYVRAEAELLATTPIPVEKILTSTRLSNTSHAGLWQSLDQLDATLVGWLTDATGCSVDEAHTRIAAATAMILGLRTLWGELLDADFAHIHQLQLAVLGLDPAD